MEIKNLWDAFGALAAVLDTVRFAEVQKDLEDPAHAIEGHFFSQERTVTLLSLEQVMEVLERAA